MLANLIRTGPTHEPLRILVHGVQGVGKTTFAAGAPDPIFIGPEDGGGDLNIARIVVSTWAELLSAVQALTSEDHAYRTVVLDTLDFLERLCHQSITKGTTTMEKAEGGYGKAYKMAAEEQVKLVQALDVLRARRRMAVIALAHTEIVKFDDPEDQAYDRYQIRMHKAAVPPWSDWADCILFANFDVKVRRTGDDVAKGKGKAVDREAPRVLYTSRRPAFDAKNRFGLDHELPLSWPDFAKAIEWDRREAAWRRPVTSEPADPLAEAARDAQKRGWKAANFAALLDSFGAKKLSDVKPEHRAGVLRALAGTPPNSQPEVK